MAKRISGPTVPISGLKDGQWKVLVIGDWIVDEDWVVSPERTWSSAVQADERHYLTTFENLDVATKRLCGTALTASAIRGFSIDDGTGKACHPFDVYGIGVWHPEDTEYLSELFISDKLPGANPFRISRPKNSGKGGVNTRLFNLARESDKASTTRIVRVFQGHAGTLPTPMARYDWHSPWQPKQKPRNWAKFLERRLNDFFSTIKFAEFDGIVLADFNKGLVNENLLIALGECFDKSGRDKATKWFIRTKSDNLSEWNNHFQTMLGPDDSLLRFFDPRLTAKIADGRRLLHGSALTREGLQVISHEIRPEKVDRFSSVMMLKDNNAIAFEAPNDVWILHSTDHPPRNTRGRSSTFLASLFASQFLAENPDQKSKYEIANLGERAASAMLHGQQWCNSCSDIWQSGSTVNVVSADIEKAVSFPVERGAIKIFGPRTVKEIDTEWDAAVKASEACCLSNDKHELRLEAWRAYTVLNDYTVLDLDRRKTVVSLRNAVHVFLELPEHDRHRPLFSLVTAEPGSGKTFLAKCLAKEFNLDFFEFNMAQASSLGDLSRFFDQVAAAQQDGRSPFVFIDEADSLVVGESAFPYLLDLLWCGTYNRAGLRQKTKPFPGLLAISGNSDDKDFKTNHPKYKDLKSRIYGLTCHIRNFTDAEKIYLFAKVVERYIGQVAYIDLRVLRCIAETNLGYGPRSLELLVSLMHSISHNTVTLGDLPKERVKKLLEHFPDGLFDVPSHLNQNLVKIIYSKPTGSRK